MGFFSKLLKKASWKKTVFNESENEDIIYDREGIDFHDQTQRTRYIAECLEQMAEGSREMDLLKSEYDMVTSYLKDMEEIEALPGAQRSGAENLLLPMNSLHLSEGGRRISPAALPQSRKMSGWQSLSGRISKGLTARERLLPSEEMSSMRPWTICAAWQSYLPLQPRFFF